MNHFQEQLCGWAHNRCGSRPARKLDSRAPRSQCREARRQRLIAEETANNKVEEDLVEESKRKSSDEVPENIVRTGNLPESSRNCDSIPVIAKAEDDAFENHRFDKKNFVDSQLDEKAKN